MGEEFLIIIFELLVSYRAYNFSVILLFCYNISVITIPAVVLKPAHTPTEKQTNIGMGIQADGNF